jgi:hypothetical protein
MFAPLSDTIESTLQRERIVTFADAKLVIQYDSHRLNEPRPYYIRFWYDPVDELWHPLDFVEIPAVDGTSPDVLF